MKKTLFLAIIALFLLKNEGYAQTYTTKKTMTGRAKNAYLEGRKYNSLDDTLSALKAFTQALKEDPTFIDAQIMQAATYYKLKRWPEAEAAFEKVVAIDPSYDPEVLFSLGNIEARQDKYEEAAAHYDAYVAQAKVPDNAKPKALKAARDARFAAQALKNPVPFRPQPMGDKINTPQYSEYLPTFSADGQTLIFTRLIGRQEDFYTSTRDSLGQWQTAQALESLNTDDNEGAQALSADGQFLFFTACNRAGGLGSCDIFFSKYQDSTWTAPKVFVAASSPSWESQPTLSADNKTLYFASNRPGGLGGIDIWFVRFENGKWQAPQNIGAPINTEGDDQTPFIHPDGETLYFTSDGHAGMGGRDLYLSRWQGDSAWSAPQNLGFPINTKDNEGTLAISLDGTTAYFARSQVTVQNTYQNDLYSFELYEAARPKKVTYVSGVVRDKNTRLVLANARCELIDLETQKTVQVLGSNAAGQFLACLPFGKNYAINVSKEGYVFFSENFNLLDTGLYRQPFRLDIGLWAVGKPEIGPKPTPTEGGQAIVLKNVFFETGKAQLKNASLPELNKLKVFLQENPTLRIEIRGHTDNIGQATDNQQLSEKRAKAVRDYLIQNGIEASRLVYKGLGSSQPLDSNDTEAGRAQNRRTEFIILK